MALILNPSFYFGSSLTSNALAGQQELIVSAVDKTQERTTFQLSRNLPAGSKANLQIAFSGTITGSMMGYYKSSYELDGKTKNYALTQFEVCHIYSFQKPFT
jgi:aminopeptidase 2